MDLTVSACVQGSVEKERAEPATSLWLWAQKQCQGAVWLCPGRAPLPLLVSGKTFVQGSLLLPRRVYVLWCGKRAPRVPRVLSCHGKTGIKPFFTGQLQKEPHGLCRRHLERGRSQIWPRSPRVLQSQGQPGEQAEGQSPGRGCLQLGTAQRSSGGGN